MDAKLGATLRATKCSAETYKKAIAHKRSRSFHEAISLVLKNRTLNGEDCGSLLEQCFSKLSDHYAALCCAPTSSAADLRKSYKRLCLRYHPDKSNGTTTTLFQVLVRAWEVLSDAEKRTKYDLTRKPTTGLGPKPPPKRTKRKAPCPPSVTKKTEKRPAAKTMRRPTMLRRPTGLRVTARAPHSLTVVWAQVGGAAGYEVMFRRAGRPWPEKGARVTCAAARKKNLAPAQAYEARVRAVDKAGQPASTFSCSCAAATMAAPPTKPSAAARRAAAARAAAAARKAAAPPPPPSTEAWTCRVCARGNGEDAARCRVCAAPRAYENDRLFGSAAYEKCRAEKRAAQFARPPPAPAPPAPARAGRAAARASGAAPGAAARARRRAADRHAAAEPRQQAAAVALRAARAAGRRAAAARGARRRRARRAAGCSPAAAAAAEAGPLGDAEVPRRARKDARLVRGRGGRRRRPDVLRAGDGRLLTSAAAQRAPVVPHDRRGPPLLLARADGRDDVERARRQRLARVRGAGARRAAGVRVGRGRGAGRAGPICKFHRDLNTGPEHVYGFCIFCNDAPQLAVIVNTETLYTRREWTGRTPGPWTDILQ